MGVSVYTPTQALKALEYKEIDIIQVPYNILDRRLDQCGFFQRTKKEGVTVFARSVLLQGLLTMNVNELPPQLQAAKPLLNDFENLCKKANATRLEAAISFVHAHEGIDFGIIGVNTLQQLNQILNIFKKKRNDRLIDQLANHFNHVDEKVINPTRWNK
ncbi:aldo/keto reductase [Lederbergia sp. NSJ-179]|uniref:aldo/keto reductase n=1 Tax=Lederbergia sp. NSJ-179 TaxID=2931402 RepID=UPI0028BE15BA|nr:aldo/keto reductase [Lederbergia sp. NSJ-179]